MICDSVAVSVVCFIDAVVVAIYDNVLSCWVIAEIWAGCEPCDFAVLVCVLGFAWLVLITLMYWYLCFRFWMRGCCGVNCCLIGWSCCNLVVSGQAILFWFPGCGIDLFGCAY